MNDADNTTTACDNCGKGEESRGDLKSCVACKLVKYCNRECQIAHRPLHKKACKKRAAELHDEALFREHPPTDDCPICFLPLPLDIVQTTFKSCCGKTICNGCIYAMDEEARGRGGRVINAICAFCRKQNPSSDAERVKRMEKLMEADNVGALSKLAGYYANGEMGMPQNYEKANELWFKAGELGCHEGYLNLGISYANGQGVEMDKKKAKYFYELAAMNGDAEARFNLGYEEFEAGNYHRAYKHFILAAKAGYKDSLDNVKIGHMGGIVTKDEYANTLRAYQQRHNEMKSDDRDKAEAFYNMAT